MSASELRGNPVLILVPVSISERQVGLLNPKVLANSIGSLFPHDRVKLKVLTPL